jgi:hypothetical protein
MWNASPVEAEKRQIVRSGAVTMAPSDQIVVTEITGGDVAAAKVEQIVDPVMGGEEALGLAG